MVKVNVKKKAEPKGVKEFDAIESQVVIKRVISNPECSDIKFQGFDFTSVEYGQLVRWMKTGTKLRQVLHPIDPPMPGLETPVRMDLQVAADEAAAEKAARKKTTKK